jgi:adenine/guanine phosphoribosyltransferase-like PRPP-binding protein
MPYFTKGKCVYKKDGGAKVGCTKGSVKKYLAALHANANESVDLNEIRRFVRKTLKERFILVQNTLEISEPYDKIQTINIDGRTIYVLFGNVDYYQNRESILALKRKSNELNLDHQSYRNFLEEFKKRFYSISELSDSDLVVSIETTSPVTKEMAESINIPFVESGFKKQNSSFKMRSVLPKDRPNIKDLFNIGFDIPEGKKICVMDDFITTGTSFKNAFDKLPADMNVVGVCLFKLDS